MSNIEREASIQEKKALLDNYTDLKIESDERLLQMNGANETALFAEYDINHGLMHKAICTAEELAKLTGRIMPIEASAEIQEDIDIILESSACDASAKLQRSITHCDGEYEVINYVIFDVKDDNTVALFEHDLLALYEAVKAANQQTAGKFTL